MRTLLVVLAVRFAAARSATAQSVCLAADSLGAPLLEQVRHVASSADAKMVSYRQYMQIAQTPAEQVHFVTDTRVCTKARDAYTVAIHRTDGVQPSGRIYVIQVGDVYVVHDPVQVTGEFQIQMTLSRSYEILAKYS